VRRESKSRLRPEVSIPIVSMADIAFLLIIFFMLTSTLIKETGIDVDVPKAEEVEPLPEADVAIEVTATGEIQVNNRVVTMEQLPFALTVELEKSATKVVTIRGDEKSLYGTMLPVLSAVGGQGASIRLAGEQQPQ